eukprot:scaffold400021_cov47-Attheya_sp.AAC.1
MEHRPVTVFSRVRATMFTKLSLSCSRVSRASLILWTLSLGLLHWERPVETASCCVAAVYRYIYYLSSLESQSVRA